MKLNQKILVALFCVGIFLLLGNYSYAGTQKLNSLDYEAQLNSDGSMDVVETWDIYIDETNTLFKDFDLDESKYSGITNVKVKDLDTGMDLREINKEMYHVTKNCYYGLPISNSQFEIAWGVGLDNSSATKKYQISYTIEDVVTVHNDCSELYWQFIGTDNAVSAKKVTGKIMLPQAVKEVENLKIWAHGALGGEIHKTSNDTVEFFVNHLKPQTMLEVRIVAEKEMFWQSMKNSNENHLEEIVSEETIWADEANQERAKYKSFFMIGASIYFVLLVFFAMKIMKYSKILKEVSKEQYQIDIGKYFRDIPREKDATPAEAAFLLKPYNESAVFSATLLQLCLKGYISFDVQNKNDIRIDLKNLAQNFNLKPSEKTILELLQKIAGSFNTTLTMEEMKKFAKKHYTEFGKILSGLEEKAKKANVSNGNYDLEKQTEASKYNAKAGIYAVGSLVIGFSIMFISWPIVIEWIICIVILCKIAKRVNVLTKQGTLEREQWKGLKNYMTDFSMLKERDIPDLVLWEKYLVYATAFGISDKVIKQLKVVYPQIQDLDSNTYMYLYLMSDTRFSNGFIEEFNKSTNSIYDAYRASIPSSSGSGSGGGFSSGGGGRWWRRPEWAEDKR